MLEYLRNASEKPIAKILITILAFSFIGWGVAEWVFGGAVSDTTLVRVGSAKISAQQFSNAKSREISVMSREEQRTVYTDPAEMQKFTDKIMQDLSSQQMAENRARDLGIVISDHRIADEIRSIPDFWDGGEFSASRFDSVLANAGYSEESFADMLHSQLARTAVMAPVAVQVNVPDFAVTAAYNARYATRNIEYATVSFDDYNVGHPTDDQLRSFYAQNPQTVAEVRKVSYVWVPAKMDQPDSYEAGFAVAQRVEDDIIGGDSLADVAKRHDAQFIDVGELRADSVAFDDVMDVAMISRVFHMDEGTESELIETKNGFVIARVDKVIPEHNAEFDSVKSGLVADWQRAEQKKQAYVQANDILVDLNHGRDMAKKESVTVSRASGAPVQVLNAAFNNELDSNSIVEGTDAFYVLRVVSETMPVSDDTKTADLKTELQNMSSIELSDDYNSFLKRQYPVKVNEKVYNRYFAK